MNYKKVSEAVIRRMPRYYRHLLTLKRDGVERISSSKLAEQMHLNPSQVRQDFNCFGGFGQQGYGYNVDTLLEEIRNILCLNRPYKAVVVGAGNIGIALSNFEGFASDRISILALFDVKPELIGTEISGKPILHIDELENFVKENNVDMGIITARRSVAQELADKMVAAGVKGIWNFAPVDVDVDGRVPVENVNLSDSMFCLIYKMHNQK